MRSRGRIALAALVSFTAAGLLAGEKNDIRGEGLLAGVTAIHRDALAVEKAWYRALDRLPGSDPNADPVVVRLRLKGAILKKDLLVQVMRIGGRWSDSQGRCPDLLQTVQPLGIEELKMAGDREEGTISGVLAGTLDCSFLLDKTDSRNPSSKFPVAVRLDLRIDGRKLSGGFKLTANAFETAEGKTVANPLPAAQGNVEGTVDWVAGRTGRPLDPWYSEPPASWKAGSPQTLYQGACDLERQAGRFYRRLQAVEVVRRYGMAFRDAFGQTLCQSVKRPPLERKQGDAAKRKGRGARSKKHKPPSIDDNLDDAFDLDEPGTVPKRKAPPDFSAEARAAVVPVMRRVRLFRDLISEHERDPERTWKAEIGGQDPGDPDFGPWYGEETLPDTPGKPNAVPATAGRAGPQRWPCIARWRFLGPFPLTRRDIQIPTLPALVDEDEAPHVIEIERLKRGEDYRGPDAVPWAEVRAGRHLGFVTPRDCSKTGLRWLKMPGRWQMSKTDSGRVSGLDYSTFYAKSQVFCEREIELWAGLGLVERGMLWVNGSLVWAGPDKVHPASFENTALVKIPFRKGLNNLTLRIDSGYNSHYLWMRLCVQGNPRDAVSVRSKQEAVAGVRARLPLSARDGRGWLRDGTGIYPGTHPPLAWDIKQGHNLIWRTPLPYWGGATPAVAPDRLFVTMEPMTLVCLAKDDGRVLWKRHVSTIDLMEDKDRAKGWELYEAWWKARQANDAVPASLLHGRSWVKRSWPWYWAEDKTPPKNERDGASPELLALIDKREELERAPDPAAVQDELTAVIRKIEKLREEETEARPEVRDAQEKRKRLDKVWNDLLLHIRKNSHMKKQSGYWQDYDGYAFATAVTDGKHVWWKNGSGAAACFDMDGNRKWLVATDGGGEGHITASSLLLVDGKLIMPLPSPKKGKKAPWRLTALDPATGRTLWEASPIRKSGWGYSTPAALTLTNGRDRMNVIVTHGGTVVRADDGKILLYDAGIKAPEGAFVPHGDRVFSAYNVTQCARLIMLDRDHVGFQRVWSHCYKSGACNYIGLFQAGAYAYRIVKRTKTPPDVEIPGAEAFAFILDPATGRWIRRFPLATRHACGGNLWSFFAASEDNVYFIHGDHMFNKRPPSGPPMTLTVFSQGADPAVLGRNAVDRTYSAPIIDGDRIYLRGYFGVYAIGYTGKPGRAYETRKVAENLLDAIAADAPSAQRPAPLDLEPLSRKSKLFWPVGDGTTQGTWLYAGPFGADRADRVLASFGGPAKSIEEGHEASDGEVRRKLVQLDRTHSGVRSEGLWRWDWHRDLSSRSRDRRVLHLRRILAGTPPFLGYLYCALRVSRAQTFRLEMKTPGTRAWLAGQALRDGDHVRLDEGEYGFLVEVRVDGKAKEELLFSPRFWYAGDPNQDRKRWFEFVGRHRPHLERVLDLAPASPEAKRAKAVLTQKGP